MKNCAIQIAIATLIVLSSCRDAETKADRDTIDKSSSDTSEKMSNEKIPGTTGGSAKIDTLDINTPGNILSNIDKHIICEASYPPPGPDGGIVNGTITVRNTLTSITIQRAIVEVSILLADDKEYRTDYYTIINIEPGESKVVKIPNTARGTKINSHIVKLKSDELTNGEMVLVGTRYVPK